MHDSEPLDQSVIDDSELTGRETAPGAGAVSEGPLPSPARSATPDGPLTLGEQSSDDAATRRGRPADRVRERAAGGRAGGPAAGGGGRRPPPPPPPAPVRAAGPPAAAGAPSPPPPHQPKAPPFNPQSHV